MIIYSVPYAEEGEEPGYFMCKQDAIDCAHEIADALKFNITVSRETITLTGRAMVAALLNNRGWCHKSEDIYTASPNEMETE